MYRRRTLALPALLLAVAAILATLAWARPAAAIPAFARQYGRDCQTCHVAFPKLTAFGDAFRRNGYRFPGGHDDEFEAHESIALGQDAYRDLFPHTIWPGKLPSEIRMAAQVAFRTDYFPEQDPNLSFGNLGGRLGLNFASNFDEVFSAWAGVGFSSTGGGPVETEVERIFAVIKPLDAPVLNVRVGHFEPGLFGFSMHRTLGFAPWISLTPVQDDSFTPEPAQDGVELTGVTGGGRLTYSAGVVEGGGDRTNDFKDVYSRLGVKIGGMRLDGLEVESQSAQPWREKSVQLGGFGYFGRSALGDPAVATQEDTFFLAGGDAIVNWRDFNLVLAGAFGRNQRPSLSEPTKEADSLHLMSQLDVVVYPWLIPTVRWEQRDIAGVREQRVSGGVYVLLRANVRTQVLATVEGPDSDLKLRQVLAGLNLVL